MALLVLLLAGVGVGVVEVVQAPPFMLRSVGPAEREGVRGRGHLAWHLGGAFILYVVWRPAVGQALGPEASLPGWLDPYCLEWGLVPADET